MVKERTYELCGVFAAVLLGLFLRLLSARNVLVEGDVIFYGYDSFYHMRRIFYTVENFPQTLWFDSYLNHPHGLELMWPPLFDQIIAAAALLGGGSPQAVEVAGAIISPILGSAMVILLYFLAKKLFGMKVALLSAFLLAVDPKHIARTFFGLPDHDSLELLLILGAILLLTYALTKRDRWLRFAVLAGVLIAATAYTWLGAPAYMGAILIYAMIQTVLDLKNGRSSEETIFPLMTAFGVVLVLTLPFWNDPWLLPSFSVSLATLAALSFLYVFSRFFVAKRVPWQAFVPVTVIFAYITLILSYTSSLTKGIQSALWGGVRYFFGGDLARLGVEETSRIFRFYDLVSFPTLSLVFALMGFILLVQSFRRSGFRRDQLLFIVWTVFAAALMVSQVRFLCLFSISGSVLIAILFFWMAERIKGLDRFQNVNPKEIKVIISVFLLFFFIPALSDIPTIAGHKPEITESWCESLDWLVENSPPTEWFERPVQTGEYGVLSWWDYGNWILYQSKRPVVANNFQAGAEDAASFFLSESEEDAIAIAKARDVRYVITDKKMIYGNLPAIACWIDEEPGSYVQITVDSDTIAFEHSTRFLGTILARLHLFDCMNLGHFRLVYESKTPVGFKFPVSEVKIFEQVPGAKITGTTPYDKPIGAILDMTSNQGRRFQYFNSAMPVDGRYDITVPYSTEEMYGMHAIGSYLLGPLDNVVGGEAKIIEVSEEDVLQGRVIEVNF